MPSACMAERKARDGEKVRKHDIGGSVACDAWKQVLISRWLPEPIPKVWDGLGASHPWPFATRDMAFRKLIRGLLQRQTWPFDKPPVAFRSVRYKKRRSVPAPPAMQR